MKKDTNFRFQVDLYTHPIFSLEGDYPESVKERIKQLSKEEGCSFSRLPSFTAEEVKEIRGSGLLYCCKKVCLRFVESVTDQILVHGVSQMLTELVP